MTRLVLHIGSPKSGSSAIQSFLDENADRLVTHGRRWVPGSRGANQTELAVAFCARPNAQTEAFGVRSERDRVVIRRRLRARLQAAARAGEPMVSSEHLAGLLRTSDEVERLAGFLAGTFDDVAVVVVLRRADYWLPSAWAEAVRAGRDVPLGPAFVERREHLLDQPALLARWSSAFGAKAVRGIPCLEADKNDPFAVPQRLLRSVGLTQPAEAWSSPDRLIRPGLSATAIEVLRRINPQIGRQDGWTGRDRERLVALLTDRFPGDGVRLNPAAQRSLAARGWLDTDVASHPNASGEGWPSWRAEPPAPVEAAPQPSAATVAHTLAAIRATGLDGRIGLRQVGRLLARKVPRSPVRVWRSAPDDRPPTEQP